MPEEDEVKQVEVKPTEQTELKYILTQLVPEWRKQFRSKNADYGDDPDSLGPKAIFVDIWRKARKLRRAFWDGQELNHEKPREVAMDMIGHLFLLIAQMDNEGPGWDKMGPWE